MRFWSGDQHVTVSASQNRATLSSYSAEVRRRSSVPSGLSRTDLIRYLAKMTPDEALDFLVSVLRDERPGGYGYDVYLDEVMWRWLRANRPAEVERRNGDDLRQEYYGPLSEAFLPA